MPLMRVCVFDYVFNLGLEPPSVPTIYAFPVSKQRQIERIVLVRLFCRLYFVFERLKVVAVVAGMFVVRLKLTDQCGAEVFFSSFLLPVQQLHHSTAW